MSNNQGFYKGSVFEYFPSFRLLSAYGLCGDFQIVVPDSCRTLIDVFIFARSEIDKKIADKFS